MKKFASLLISVVLLATMLTVFAVPASAEAQAIPGSKLTWELTENGTGLTLTISGEGAMPKELYGTDRPWNNDAGKITAVKINSGVTSISGWAFAYCTKITSLTISEGVTSIGEKAFYMCSFLKEVKIPGSVESIGVFAFEGCGFITTLTLSEGVTSIGEGAFSTCGLKEVTIPKTVTSIGSEAFIACSSLKEVTIPGTVKSIGFNAFSECDPALVIHGTSGTAAEQYANEHYIDFFGNGKCKHFARFTCDRCNTHLTRSELLKAWNSNGVTGSTLSEGSLTIICTIAAAVVFGLGGFILGTKKKKKPALAGGAESDE